jgi:pimeloyl-ACP methyl ester carboxylesterase
MRQISATTMTITSPLPEFSWTPNRGSAITTRFVEANGQRFELAETGDAKSFRLAILLHGFPELNFSWRHQMPVLAEKGWRVWAPNMRGYGASSKPKGVAAYRIDGLLQDVAALIDLAKAENSTTEVMLVAHDWGAIIAWMFAIRKVRSLDRLVIMNVPHPKCAAGAQKLVYLFLPIALVTRKIAACPLRPRRASGVYRDRRKQKQFFERGTGGLCGRCPASRCDYGDAELLPRVAALSRFAQCGGRDGGYRDAGNLGRE